MKIENDKIIFKSKKEEKNYYIRKSYYNEYGRICYYWITSSGSSSRDMTEKEISRCKRTRLFRQLGVDNFDY